ncbi:MAG: hypothetical protein E7646_08790 [Ruminococcaceae bacterium]|nr:hypothetical protein [Oscillospiraceae bacterium]
MFNLLFPQICSSQLILAYQRVTLSLIPSLFLSSVLSSMITRSKLSLFLKKLVYLPMGRIFKTTPEESLALFLSFLLGYPIGVKTLEEEYSLGLITKKQYIFCLCFSNNCGAAFIFSYLASFPTVGKKGALIIFLSQILSTAAIARVKQKNSRHPYALSAFIPHTSAARLISLSVKDACRNMCHLGGFVLFFSGICGALSALLPFLDEDKLYLIFEISGFFRAGAKSIPLCAFAVGWGGICVYMQSLAISDTLNEMKSYLFYKVLNGALMALISWVFCKIFL